MTRLLKIAFTVEEGAAGSLLADLADRVRSLDFEVVELVDRRSVKKIKKKERKTQRKEGETAGIIKRALSRGPKTSAAVLEETKLTKSQVYSMLNFLKGRGEVKRNAEGLYNLTAKGKTT